MGRHVHIPFDGTKATLMKCLDEAVDSSNMLAVPAPTIATLTHGDPAALPKKKNRSKNYENFSKSNSLYGLSKKK